MINVPELFRKMDDYLASAPVTTSLSFSAFTDELHGKGREKCISNGGCIIIDNYDDDVDDDGGEEEYSGSDEPRRSNIVYIRSSKSVQRRFLFLGSTRERVSAGAPLHYIRRLEERGME